MPRQLTPELLDQLAFDDPAAIRSRADLRIINTIAGNHRWLDKCLRQLKPRHVVELGAGCARLSQRLALWTEPVHYTGIDLIPAPADLSEEHDWVQGDVMTHLPEAAGDVLVANLFLHHLSDSELRSLGQHLKGYQAVLCCEPARFKRNHLLGFLLRPLGINHVTRNDLHLSIEAGFRSAELPAVLGLRSSEWSVRTDHTPLGIYRMLATRDSRL